MLSGNDLGQHIFADLDIGESTANGASADGKNAITCVFSCSPPRGIGISRSS